MRSETKNQSDPLTDRTLMLKLACYGENMS